MTQFPPIGDKIPISPIKDVTETAKKAKDATNQLIQHILDNNYINATNPTILQKVANNIISLNHAVNQIS